MTHQCPKCELRFTWVTELNDHCRTDHPGFQHDYPSSVHHDYSTPTVHVAEGAHPVPARTEGEDAERSTDILGTYWNER
jgi:hypothetical protein